MNYHCFILDCMQLCTINLALNVFSWQSTGSPPSSFRIPYDSFRVNLVAPDADDFLEDGSSADISIQNIETDLDYDFLCFFLSSPRVALYRSIDFRCEDMLSGKNKCYYLISNNLQEYNCSPIAWHLTVISLFLSDSSNYNPKKRQFACSLLCRMQFCIYLLGIASEFIFPWCFVSQLRTQWSFVRS